MNEFLHEGEDVGIVGGGGQHQLAVAEGILHRLGPVVPLHTGDRHLGAALLLQLLGQQLHGLLRVAVHRGVGDHDALALHAVARPDAVQPQGLRQLRAGQHRAVKGAHRLDVHRRGLLQQRLYLRAELTHDAEVVAPRLAGPALGILHI